MSSTKRKGSSSSSSASRKKKNQSLLSFGSGSKEKEIEALNQLYRGKRLLIPAKGVYDSDAAIPPEEQDLLFVYKFRNVNPDGQKASLDFENKCIKHGGNKWVNFADTAAADADMDSELLNYDYKNHMKDDPTRDTTIFLARSIGL